MTITGSVRLKRDNPALPVTVAERVASTQAAFEAGATPCDIRGREADESLLRPRHIRRRAVT